MSILKLTNDLLDLIYPKCCAGCKEPLISGEKLICSSCLIELPITEHYKQSDNPVFKLFMGRVTVKSASAFLHFEKGGIVQQMMHNLKYQGQQDLGVYLGRMMGISLKNWSLLSTIDYIIPVPLHPGKLARRGYNQSELLARGLSETTGIPVLTESLVRVANNATQTRKSRFERWENVASIFEINRSELIEHKHLLLIDDVITTGATAEACISKLLGIEGVQVSLLTLAYAKH